MTGEFDAQLCGAELAAFRLSKRKIVANFALAFVRVMMRQEKNIGLDVMEISSP
jgi:hypothetical protein